MNCSPLLCFICGDIARGYNFDAITCMSCKIFFRRHALRAPGTYRCARSNNCQIVTKTRKNCIACRLRKCFDMGMNRSRICSSQLNRNLSKKHSPPQTLSLLRNDRSSLTFDQWRLLSNIIHIYDNQNLFKTLHQSLTQESSLPVKLRIKPTHVINYIQQCISTTQMFLKQISYFQKLSIETRRLVIRNNFYLACFFNAILAGREVDLWSYQDFGISYDLLFGIKFFYKYESIPKRLDPNTTLSKLMLLIILFSSNYSIVIYDKSINMTNVRSSIELVRIQDIFIEVIWKYLNYEYGFHEAVNRYSSLVKSLLDNLGAADDLMDSAIYHQMLDGVITQTEQLLINDE